MTTIILYYKNFTLNTSEFDRILNCTYFVQNLVLYISMHNLLKFHSFEIDCILRYFVDKNIVIQITINLVHYVLS